MHGLQWGNPTPIQDLPTAAQFLYDLYFIDVPVNANFNFGKGKLRWCVGAGAAANIFLEEKVRYKLWYGAGKPKRNIRDSQFIYDRLNVSPQISGGVNYHLSNRFYMKAEPTARIQLLKLIDAPVTTRLWNVGLNIGCYVTL